MRCASARRRCCAGSPVTHARLREDQWRAIEALVADRRRVLCVQRTGWGKSAVYFVATALLRAGSRASPAGPTVIVSPLLALMRNQVEAAARAGIRARTINSANLDEWDEITAEIRAGAVDVLLVSPERLNNPDFRDNVLPRLAATHRPAGRRRGALRLRLGPRLPPRLPAAAHASWPTCPGTPVLATTATANARVTADVAEQLGDAPGAARPAGPRVAAAGRAATCPARRTGWPGSPTTWTRCPAPGSSTR